MLRWQIELLFKEWKSYANLHKFGTANVLARQRAALEPKTRPQDRPPRIGLVVVGDRSSLITYGSDQATLV